MSKSNTRKIADAAEANAEAAMIGAAHSPGDLDPHGGVRITTGDVNRLTTRAERTGKLTIAEVLDLARERKAHELKTASAIVATADHPNGRDVVADTVPRSGLHDGQDPPAVQGNPADYSTSPQPAEVLSTRKLAAVLRNDTQAWNEAGRFPIAVAVAELERRRDHPKATEEARNEAIEALAAGVAPFERAAPPADPGILEQNGYAAIRSAMLAVCEALGGIHRDAIAAAVEYNAAAVRRLRLNTTGDPRVAQALEAAELEGRYLDAVRRMSRDLRELEQRIQAGDRIVR